MLRFFPFLAALFLLSKQVQAACYEEAAQRYAVSESLLRAIAKVESGNRDAKTVENVNANGTRDIGRMQINTGWLPTLKQYGIGEKELRDECTSIHVGAWIISQNISAKGLSWDAVGAYNVGCKGLTKDDCQARRNRYAWRVFRLLKPHEQKKPEPSPPVAAVVERKRSIGSVEFHDQ
jgi:soluble lytic murein transglycosylase-like protein